MEAFVFDPCPHRHVLHYHVDSPEDAYELLLAQGRLELHIPDELMIFMGCDQPSAKKFVADLLGVERLTPGLFWGHCVTARALCTRLPSETAPPPGFPFTNPKKVEVAIKPRACGAAQASTASTADELVWRAFPGGHVRHQMKVEQTSPTMLKCETTCGLSIRAQELSTLKLPECKRCLKKASASD